MPKQRLDLLTILLTALVICGGILLWGEQLGVRNAEHQTTWLSAIALGALVLAIGVSFMYWSRWVDAVRHVRQWLSSRQSGLAGTTQGAMLAGEAEPANVGASLAPLRDALRHRHGWRWRYRQPWLLLVDADGGSEATVGRLSPELKAQGWLVTADAVLLLGKTDADGQPDVAWLKELRKLRRWRPLDAIVLVFDEHIADTRRDNAGRSMATWLLRCADVLRWSTPVFALEVAQTALGSALGPAVASALGATSDAPLIACELPAQAGRAEIEAALQALTQKLARQSLNQLPMTASGCHLGVLSKRLDGHASKLADILAGLSGHARHVRQRAPLRGIAFVPAFDPASSMASAANLPVWQHVADSAQRSPGRRTALHPLLIGAGVALAGIVLWVAGMAISGVRIDHDIRMAARAVQDVEAAPGEAARLKALSELQQQIRRYEYRTRNRAPLFTRFGLNRDAEVLAALMRPYAQASRELVVQPVVRSLEATLTDLSRMQTTGLSGEPGKAVLDARDALKAYLMLAEPERVETTFLAAQLADHWSTDARISPGLRLDYAERLASFHAERLAANPDWHIAPRAELVGGARQTLLAMIGERNAVDTVYRNLLDGAGNKYPDLTLASLTSGTDPRGLMRTHAVVPGIFTRQAYEGYVASAVEKAAANRDGASDWTLAADQPSAPGESEEADAEAFREALTARYFADYAEAWQQFLNGLQWAAAPTVPGVADQLKLMADARQSPVIALMRSVAYHGGAGARRASLSDTLVNKTREILGRKGTGPDVAVPDPAGPLQGAFGPVLRLVDQSQQPGGGELSLQRYLDRVTAVRLRLQQMTMSSDAEAEARQMAQALFQGKSSELADTHSYGQRMAASLGAEWAGLGNALFVRPIAQASQAIVQPAQASLNESWQRGIARPWARSFAGRYPFVDTANDASLPELARFLRLQGGLIQEFLSTHLAGVLVLQGDEWVPTTTGGQSLAFDPVFLQRINTLQRIATHLLPQGEPRYRFQLKPVPTPGLTETLLRIDNRTLHYFNQKEAWMPMHWPADNLQEPGTRLQWQTEVSGTSKNHEFAGAWGLVRMLERASVTPVDGGTFELMWRALPDTQAPPASRASAPGATAERKPANGEHGDQDSMNPRQAMAAAPADMAYPIRYLLRTEVGHGPLEMLWLRDFILPSRIFAIEKRAAATPPARH